MLFLLNKYTWDLANPFNLNIYLFFSSANKSMRGCKKPSPETL